MTPTQWASAKWEGDKVLQVKHPPPPPPPNFNFEHITPKEPLGPPPKKAAPTLEENWNTQPKRQAPMPEKQWPPLYGDLRVLDQQRKGWEAISKAPMPPPPPPARPSSSTAGNRGDSSGASSSAGTRPTQSKRWKKNHPGLIAEPNFAPIPTTVIPPMAKQNSSHALAWSTDGSVTCRQCNFKLHKNTLTCPNCGLRLESSDQLLIINKHLDDEMPTANVPARDFPPDVEIPAANSAMSLSLIHI